MEKTQCSRTKKPVDKFNNIIRYMRLAAGYCGADVFDVNYKVSIRTIIVFGCIFSYFGFSFYTCHVKTSEDWGVILEILCMSGSVLQGLSKLISGIVFNKKIISLVDFSRSIYQNFVDKSESYENVLNKCLNRLSTIFKLTILNTALSLLIMVSTPLVFLIFHRKRIFCMQFLIPGFNPDTTTGYYLTLSSQYIYMGFGAIGNTAGDLAFVLLVLHFTLISDILDLKVKDLNDVLVKEIKDQKKIKYMLKDIAVWHQKYIIYKSTSNNICYWNVFVQITTTTFSLTLTLYVIVAGEWPAAYAYFMFNFTMLIVYSCLGTVVEFTNSNIIQSLEDVSWYNLSVQDQKLLQIMIVNAQTQDIISIGGLAPLSANTGLQVLKTIYSYFMLIRQFLIE